MKRCVCTILTLFFTFFLLSATAIDCDTHSYIEPATPTERLSHVEYSSAGHLAYYEELLICYVCGSNNWIPRRINPIISSSHDYSVQLRDLGHTINDIHQYVMGCSFEDCPFSITLGIHCDDICVSWKNKVRPIAPETE